MKIFSLLFLLFYSVVFSQDRLISTYEHQLKSEKSIDEKLIFRAKIANAKRFLQTNESVKEAQKIIEEARKIDDKSTLCEVYTTVYKVFYKAKMYQEMITCADNALLLSKNLQSNDLKGKALLAKARVLTNLNENTKSLEYLHLAFQTLQKTNSNSDLREATYFLSGIYGERGDLDKQKKYAELSYNYAEKSNVAEDKVAALQIMGTLFSDIFKRSKSTIDYKKAIAYYEKGIQYATKYNDEIITRSNLPIMAFNLAELWYREEKSTKKKEIISHILLAKNYGLQARQKDIIFNANSLLSSIYADEKNFAQAEAILTEAIDHYETPQAKNFYCLYNLYESRANLNKLMREESKAFADLQRSIEYYKELTDEKQMEAANLLEAKFDAKNKEEKIALLEEKNQKQLRFNGLLVIFSLLLMVGLYLLFRNYRIKEKLNKEIVLKKELEQEKLQAEQEIASLKTEQLQKELIANSLQIERKNEVLQLVKEKITDAKIDEKSKQKIKFLLQEEFRLDKDFDQLKTELSTIHPHFFEKLKERSVQKLSELDLKYAGAIYLGMNTKQMAQVFQIEPESVRMSKYRLKQKLGLEKDMDLTDFLRNDFLHSQSKTGKNSSN